MRWQDIEQAAYFRNPFLTQQRGFRLGSRVTAQIVFT
jgi:hypothetical protein